MKDRTYKFTIVKKSHMIMKSVILILLLTFNFSFNFLYADFAYLGCGARATGLGNTYTAFCDDVYGLYYNPGGIGFCRHPQLGVEYGRLHWGLKDESNLSNGFLGYIHPFKNNPGTLGFAWQSFSLIGHYTENSLIFCYSYKLKPNISAGISLKPLYQTYTMDDYTRIDPVFDYGKKTANLVLGVDQGILWNFHRDYFIGLSFLNINQPDIGLLESENLPMNINLGIAYRKNYSYGSLFGLGLDLEYQDTDFKVHSGIEKWFNNAKWALRSGFGFGSRQYYNFSIGASIRFKLGYFDYSLNLPVSGIQSTLGTHRISITYTFAPLEKVILPSEYKQEKERLQNKIQELEEELKETEMTVESITNNKKKEIEQLNIHIKDIETQLKENKNELKLTQEKLKQRVTPRPKPSKKKPKIRTHTVRKGDTLLSIAEKYYRDATRWKEIYNANKGKIERGQIISGQVLTIP